MGEQRIGRIASRSAARRARWAFACAACALLAGCGVYRIPFPSGSIASGLVGGDGRRIFVAAPFADERPRYDDCAKDTGPIPLLYCAPRAPEWFAVQLEQALRQAGFEVLDAEARLAPDEPRIEGALLRYAVENRPGMSEVTSEADAHVRLRIRTASGLDAQRSFFAKSARASSVATSGSMRRGALDEVSQRIFHDMVAAILSLMNRYPGLGTAPVEQGAEASRP
jgi:hypothetical protein